MDCPTCNRELEWHDWYGTNMGSTREPNKLGDIYICQNEECESYEEHFHTRQGELCEGYPC